MGKYVEKEENTRRGDGWVKKETSSAETFIAIQCSCPQIVFFFFTSTSCPNTCSNAYLGSIQTVLHVPYPFCRNLFCNKISAISLWISIGGRNISLVHFAKGVEQCLEQWRNRRCQVHALSAVTLDRFWLPVVAKGTLYTNENALQLVYCLPNNAPHKT